MGANTALIDACDLGKGIIDCFAKDDDLRLTLRQYGKDMVPRGRQIVLESRATGESMDAKEVAGGRMQPARSAGVEEELAHGTRVEARYQ